MDFLDSFGYRVSTYMWLIVFFVVYLWLWPASYLLKAWTVENTHSFLSKWVANLQFTCPAFIDVDTPKYKKSRRVRSWYLYEQFKSLERNQIDAARKLKSRSYQDRILRQELSERKARRKLYDQFGYSQSDCGIEPSIKSDSTKTSLNVSTDDFFESFHEFQNDELNQIGDHEDDRSECQSVKFCEDDFKSGDDEKDDQSGAESVINVYSEETLTENIIEKSMKPKHTPKHIELNFDAVKDKLHCLDRLTQMGDMDMDKYSDNAEMVDDEELKHIMEDKNINTNDNNVYFMWNKLVSFAYQIMELNHGNCYYDYGSQFLTAVLACDVLRRGINRMCDILQPYVSPLKFSTDSDWSDKKHKINERKKIYRRSIYSTHNYKRRNLKNILNATAQKFRRDILDRSLYSKQAINAKKFRGASEPGGKFRPYRRDPTTNISHHTIWPGFDSDLHDLCVKTCTQCCRKVVNPMLHVSWYLDKLMRDADVL